MNWFLALVSILSSETIMSSGFTWMVALPVLSTAALTTTFPTST